MALTKIQCDKAAGKEKSYKLSDQGGLHLLIQPNGRKYWRFNYRFEGKQKTMALGVYPKCSLAAARAKHRDAKDLLEAGQDPMAMKKEVLIAGEAAHSFQAIAEEWRLKSESEWSAKYSDTVKKRLERHIYPEFGRMEVTEIEPPIVLAAIRKLENRGTNELAHKTCGYVGRVFRYAIATSRAQRDPTADLRDALQTVSYQPMAHLNPKEFPELVRAVDRYHGRLLTKLATQFLMMTFVRTSEMRLATWSEIDRDEKLWRIPAERMKMNRAHLVPLPRQALELLDAIEELTGQYDYLFPHYRNPVKPMSGNTVIQALYRLGFHSRATGHGMRHTASTILNERGFSPDAIELQLAHKIGGVHGVYNKALYLDDRRAMMQWWADYLDSLKG